MPANRADHAWTLPSSGPASEYRQQHTGSQRQPAPTDAREPQVIRTSRHRESVFDAAQSRCCDRRPGQAKSSPPHLNSSARSKEVERCPEGAASGRARALATARAGRRPSTSRRWPTSGVPPAFRLLVPGHHETPCVSEARCATTADVRRRRELRPSRRALLPTDQSDRRPRGRRITSRWSVSHLQTVRGPGWCRRFESGGTFPASRAQIERVDAGSKGTGLDPRSGSRCGGGRSSTPPPLPDR